MTPFALRPVPRSAAKKPWFVTLRAVLVAATALASAIAPANATHVDKAAGNTPPELWAVQASAGLDPPVAAALAQIVSADRRLLALRGYLRARGTLAARWSWSQEQLASYPATPEGKAAMADIDAVVAAFADANPGFTLQANRQPRSLELQIARWSLNESVGAAAAALVAALEKRFSDQNQAPDTDELRSALADWQPDSAITLAAPGLSAHGQGRAFDFRVEQSGHIIAGAEVSSARRRWDAAGWTQKLRTAVRMAGEHFSGPLRSPYEPWHYAYSPRAVALDLPLPAGPAH
jgi:hypothetical protein